MLKMIKYCLASLLWVTSLLAGQAQTLPTESISYQKVWIDPAIDTEASANRIVVWFDEQFLGSGNSFEKRTKEFAGQKRSVLSRKVIQTLKGLNQKSIAKVAEALNQLESTGGIKELTPHWVINGFSAVVTSEGLSSIQKLSGVSKIFHKRPVNANRNDNVGPEYLKDNPESSFDLDNLTSYPWNIEQIRAPEVWNKHGIFGEGTLNIVHDFGFKLDTRPLAETLYINQGEIPGNGIDDDKNGFIDDYNGYNFDAKNADVNQPRLRGTLIHGNACAAMISGTFALNTTNAIGIAPRSKWAPVIGISNIESAVEWAIEQGADTYSMSFSSPNLGEARSHWRKVMEQATFCGVVFISGAGNFAAGNGVAPVPVQMRNPEDIPNAVLGVAGVGQDGKRPPFSSQGHVEWNTEHYQDGKVNKPDFATLNFQIDCVDLEGNLSNMASGNSFAGPHMAGIVSLMLSANPELLPWDVKTILIKIAKDIGAPGFDYQSGHGFVNALDAVEAALVWQPKK